LSGAVSTLPPKPTAEVLLAPGRDELEAMHALRGHPSEGAPAHARGRLLDLVAERPQYGREQRIVLETVSAAAAIDELGLERGGIEFHRPAQ